VGERVGRGSDRLFDMEITEYLTSARDRFWILIVVPALAVGLFLVMSMSSTNTYSATATVAGPWVVGAPNSPYSGAQGAADFVADFSAATTLEPVVNDVAQATGAPAAEVREGITSTPIGDSAIVQVRYETSDRSNAAPVANAVAIESLEFLFAPQVMLAQRSVEEAEARVGAAEEALVDFAEENGLTLPASGAELRALGDDLATYQQLEQQRDEAVSRYGILQAELDQANRLFEGAGEEFAVTVTSPTSVSSGGLIGGAAVAAGAGLLLAVGIVALIETALPKGSRRGTATWRRRAEHGAGLWGSIQGRARRLARTTSIAGGGGNRETKPSQAEEPEGATADGPAAWWQEGPSPYATRASAAVRGRAKADEARMIESGDGRAAARASQAATESQSGPSREKAEPKKAAAGSTKRAPRTETRRSVDKAAPRGKRRSREGKESDPQAQGDSARRTVEQEKVTSDDAAQKKPGRTEEPETVATEDSAGDENLPADEDRKKPSEAAAPAAEEELARGEVEKEDASSAQTPKKSTRTRAKKTRSSTRASSEGPPSDRS
jgi:hypothetical protein